MLRPRRSAGALVALAGVLLLGGCTGDDAPAVADFAAGTCRTAAPDVLALAEVVDGLGDDSRVPDADKAALRDAHRRLIETTAAAAAPEQQVLQRLVETVGLLRIRADGNTYEPFLADDVRSATDGVYAVCTSA